MTLNEMNNARFFPSDSEGRSSNSVVETLHMLNFKKAIRFIIVDKPDAEFCKVGARK